ncbi:MAG TPA: hypothetical protein VGN60_01375 [Devosia sp.]|jgi:hypothetical protein|nr:hypothetical protein [Devosia sp.]
MSKTVTVKVLREHSGDSGHHPEKSDYPTSLTHARQLKAQGLVEFDEADAVEDEAVQISKATPVSGLKSEPPPKNKAEPAPANKAEGKPRNKSDRK